MGIIIAIHGAGLAGQSVSTSREAAGRLLHALVSASSAARTSKGGAFNRKHECMFRMYARNYQSYTHFIPDFGIVREPAVCWFIPSPSLFIRDIGLGV